MTTRPSQMLDHQHSETVIVAAQWLADARERPDAIIPHLRQRFGLTAVEACEACALANSFRIARSAHA